MGIRVRASGIAAVTGLLMAGGLAAQSGAGAGVGAGAVPEMRALHQYIGEWRSEQHEARDGRTFRYGYRLEWFDPAQTMVEMLITQHFTDGEDRVLWKGFKGWDPVDERVYYHGFSPGGRAATGHLEMAGDSLVTVYRGWAAQGGSESAVRLRDLFTPVRDGSYDAITYLRAAPDEAWRIVNRDRWTRGSGS